MFRTVAAGVPTVVERLDASGELLDYRTRVALALHDLVAANHDLVVATTRRVDTETFVEAREAHAAALATYQRVVALHPTFCDVLVAGAPEALRDRDGATFAGPVVSDTATPVLMDGTVYDAGAGTVSPKRRREEAARERLAARPPLDVEADRLAEQDEIAEAAFAPSDLAYFQATGRWPIDWLPDLEPDAALDAHDRVTDDLSGVWS